MYYVFVYCMFIMFMYIDNCEFFVSYKGEYDVVIFFELR